jgi:hypothetical protein
MCEMDAVVRRKGICTGRVQATPARVRRDKMMSDFMVVKSECLCRGLVLGRFGVVQARIFECACLIGPAGGPREP